uniref:Thymosin beta n=1 Tax=Oryzias melastigma TaxID=30732 RepID=A0A3B3BNC8_ORYME
MSDRTPVKQEVESFNKQKLKKTNTQEKNHLPTQEEMKQIFRSRPISSTVSCAAMIS